MKSIKGEHHAHVRKRIHKKHEKYPHPDTTKRFVDRAIYFVALLSPIMTIPQLWNIWVDRNATGVSILSWITYTFVSAFWLWYGILHKEKPIIFIQFIWIILGMFVVLGIVFHG